MGFSEVFELHELQPQMLRTFPLLLCYLVTVLHCWFCMKNKSQKVFT